MFDDLAAYFYENVVTAYMQFKEAREKPVAGRSTDLRLAINAATSLYHLREHLPQQNAKTRKSLSLLCPDYDLLGDIVNASKHKEVTRGTPQVISADSIYEEVVCTEYLDEKGKYMHCEKAVMIDLVDGTKRDIFEILTNVINMWFSELNNIGAIPAKKQFSLSQTSIPPRSTESGIPQLDLVMMQGVRF